MRKKYLLAVIFVFTSLSAGNALAGDAYCKIANAVFVGLLPSLEKVKPDYKFGELICIAGGGSALSCSNSMSLVEGICAAAGIRNLRKIT